MIFLCFYIINATTHISAEDDNKIIITYTENNTDYLLAERNPQDLKEVEKLTIEQANFAKISFLEPIDLSTDQLNKGNLLEHISFTRLGTIYLTNTGKMFLEKNAVVTFYNLPYYKTPLLMKNSELVNKDEIKNLTYVLSTQSNKGKLSFTAMPLANFSVTGFDSHISDTKNPYFVNGTGRLLLIIALITLQGIGVAIIVKLIEKRKIQENT